MSANYVIKLLTLGETEVGKTSIVLRYSDDKFHEDKIATIGIDFKIKIIRKGNEVIKVSIYDTAGEERFKTLIKHYYRGANGILLIFDLTKKSTFDKLNFWLEDLRENSDNIDNLYIHLIGNKNDLEEQRAISFEEATNFAKKNKLPYMEVSAKTGKNIKNLFDEVIKGAMIKMINNLKENDKKDIMTLSFLDKDEVKEKNLFCC
jgi:small GTP-binding protein